MLLNQTRLIINYFTRFIYFVSIHGIYHRNKLCIFQAQIVGQNAHKFLKNNGHAVISIKANCIDSTAEPEAVFASEVNKLREDQFKPIEQVTLEPYERDHAVVVAEYRAITKKVKTEKSE